ncbi:50S ribosomal protein L29 [Acidilobus sp.]|uniref:50S ribosomal protein L29 n=1 Tax=Acidilobus sp. TaxID=1872109 RepID=UPI003CFD13EF
MAKYRLSPDDLRKRSLEELTKLLQEQRGELTSLRQKALSGSIDSPAKIREIRKNIARILTVMNELSRKSQQTKTAAETTNSQQGQG